jgi:hypothetical protein
VVRAAFRLRPEAGRRSSAGGTRWFPLKALAVDIDANLAEPLREIAEVARELGYEPAPIRIAVRTGDSTASQRQMMLRRPPNLLVTTPGRGRLDDRPIADLGHRWRGIMLLNR